MAKNSIVVTDRVHIREEETATAVAITPGHLIERTSGDLVQKHSTAGGPCAPRFAIEDAPQGNAITDAYAISARILTWRPVPGELVYAIADSGGGIVIGDFVESAGDGTLRKLSAAQSSVAVDEFASNVVGIAREAAGAGDRFIVEING